MKSVKEMVMHICYNGTNPTPTRELPEDITDLWNGICAVSKFDKLTNVYLIDKVPEIKGTHWGDEPIVLEQVGTLDFWNDIEGFFLYAARIKCNIVDFRISDWEIPYYVELKPEITCDRKPGEYIIGDTFVDKDYNVYVITDGPGVEYTCTCEKCGHKEIVNTRNYVPPITAYGYINVCCTNCGGDAYARWHGHNGDRSFTVG
jgi:hypothetical protein